MSVEATIEVQAKLSSSEVLGQTFDEEITDFDAVSPAWDGEANAVAGFDAESDPDNDLNDHVDAAHDGAVGLELTFDNVTAAYGALNPDAVDQTTGVFQFWFNANDVAIDASANIALFQARDGGSAISWLGYVGNQAGTLKILCAYYDDTPAVNFPGGWVGDVTTGWHHICFMVSASTGVGND